MKTIKTWLIGEKGMTMVELLVALALISIVACGLIAVYWSGSSALEGENTRIDAQYDARIAMDKISRDIQESSFREVQDVIEENNDDKKGRKLYLKTKDDSNKVHQITYRLNDKVRDKDNYRKLQRVYNNGRNIDTKTITFNQADISFTDMAGGLVKIEIMIKDDKDNQVYKIVTCCKSRVD